MNGFTKIRQKIFFVKTLGRVRLPINRIIAESYINQYLECRLIAIVSEKNLSEDFNEIKQLWEKIFAYYPQKLSKADRIGHREEKEIKEIHAIIDSGKRIQENLCTIDLKNLFKDNKDNKPYFNNDELMAAIEVYIQKSMSPNFDESKHQDELEQLNHKIHSIAIEQLASLNNDIESFLNFEIDFTSSRQNVFKPGEPETIGGPLALAVGFFAPFTSAGNNNGF